MEVNEVNIDLLEKKEDAIVNRHLGFNIVIGCIAALAGILFGFDTGVISGILLFVQKQFGLTAFSTGLLVGTVPAGALIGAFISGRIVDHLGRRKLLIVTAIIYIIGTLGCTQAKTPELLILSRFLVGLGIGISSYTAPLYISEIAPTHFRGALVSLNQLAVTIGIVLAYLVDYSLAPTASWRSMFAVGFIPAVLLFVGMLFLPESPRWLVFRGKVNEALKVLSKIRPAPQVEKELQQIINATSKRADWRLLLQKWTRPALLIAVSLAILQQITGINTIIYYAPTIFHMAGFQSAQSALLATVGIGIVNVISTIVAIPLIDRWGRRPLLILGISLMTISLAFLSYIFYTQKITDEESYIALACIIAYIIGFAISLGPIAWLMIVEIFPLEIRGLGSSVATACNWGSNMIVGLTFLTLLAWLTAAGTFLLFAVISIFSLIFIYFVIPETKDTSLEMIENNLRAGKPTRYIGSNV